MKLKEKLYNYLKIEDLKLNVTSLIETKIELLRMDVEDKFIEAIAKVIYFLVKIMLVFIVVCFGLVMLAIALNKVLNSSWLGFAIIFLIILIPLGIWMLKKPTMTQMIQQKVIQELEKEEKK